MFTYLPFTAMFTFLIFMSTLMILSSSNFLIMWASLEMNLLSLIPLMTMSKTKLETEAAVKYFLAQALGSGLILTSYITILHNQESTLTPLMSLITFSMGILTKLGAAPMHFWFPSVMASLPWPLCILLATWQKLAPLMMMSTLMSPSSLILMTSSILSALIGGIMGLNQTNLTSLIAYSSIGHLGWIIAAMSVSNMYMYLYFILYSITSGTLMYTLFSLNMYSIKQLPTAQPLHPKTSLTISILLLSLGGLPPLLGFVPKLIVLSALINNSHIMLSIPLIIGSTLNLAYYLAIVFNINITMLASPHKAYQPQKLPLSSILSIILPIFILPFLI